MYVTHEIGSTLEIKISHIANVCFSESIKPTLIDINNIDSTRVVQVTRTLSVCAVLPSTLFGGKTQRSFKFDYILE